MQIHQQNFEAAELRTIGSDVLLELGSATFGLARRLGSPDAVQLEGDLPLLAETLASIDPAVLPTEALPHFESHASEAGHLVTARFPGKVRNRPPVIADLSYTLIKPRRDAFSNQLTHKTVLDRAAIACYPNLHPRQRPARPEEWSGELAVITVIKALRRLRRDRLPEGVHWKTSDDAD